MKVKYDPVLGRIRESDNQNSRILKLETRIETLENKDNSSVITELETRVEKIEPLLLRVYKKLTSEDRTVSVKDNMVAEIDLSAVSDFPEIVSLNTTNELVARIDKRDSLSHYYLSYSDNNKKDTLLCFGSFPTDEYSRFINLGWYGQTEDGFNDQEIFMRGEPTGFEFWKKVVSERYKDYEESTSPNNLFKVRDTEGNFLEYTLVDYLNDFPYMMNMDEIKSYLTELFIAGMFHGRDYIGVPLTDRIYIPEAQFRIDEDGGKYELMYGSYVYIAWFHIYYDGGFRVYYVCTNGANTFGNSIYYPTVELSRTALVFCQKKRAGFEILDIPILPPTDFNKFNSAIIKVLNSRACYLNLIAKGYDFLPLHGDIPLNSSRDGFIIPMEPYTTSKTEGSITIQTINKDGKDTFLIQAVLHGTHVSNTYTADDMTNYEDYDLLDNCYPANIYSSR